MVTFDIFISCSTFTLAYFKLLSFSPERSSFSSDCLLFFPNSFCEVIILATKAKLNRWRRTVIWLFLRYYSNCSVSDKPSSAHRPHHWSSQIISTESGSATSNIHPNESDGQVLICLDVITQVLIEFTVCNRRTVLTVRFSYWNRLEVVSRSLIDYNEGLFC